MSSIPVRRTARVARSTKDSENANARPSRLTSRTKSALGAATTATSGRATASTAASKAKSITSDSTKEEAGVKRKREVLVEVTGLVTNNKAKSADVKGKEGGKLKEAVAKPKAVATSTRRFIGGAALRRIPRATSESTTVSKTDTEATADSKSSVDHASEKMEIDQVLPPTKEEDEESQRVFKRRHTEEKPVIAAEVLDDSQAEADKVAAQLEVEPSSSNAQLWDDLDEEDFDDPVMVSEYVVDVCTYLKEIELATMPNPDYMEEQNEITWENRGTLIDWLLQVHAKFGLLSESLFLTVNLIDRFLASRPISIAKLQLVGLACFFIATKFEETYSPSVKEIAYLSDKQYDEDEIRKAERYILRILEWDLRAPGPMNWLRRGSKADDCEVHARTIAKYLIEIGLVERQLIRFVPSLISATALWLARLSLGREEWTANLEHYTTYSEEELFPVANIMLEYIITEPVQHQSLYKKYAAKRYFRCSKFMYDWCRERWTENANVNIAKDLPQLKADIRDYRAEVEARRANGEEDAAAVEEDADAVA
ncbi:hypothetical protein M413DRAFT_444730 [Hebeloma cylindrosporum]|uniref:Uncharacterized protein n=1 Tax=Hebeloma cylindrosporum TaxID=76867 RepID=A0A0C2XXC4_HEBCY|nr:hypothetical protein M413DRAFT_444730 [Hebeloma cylindrosporum h7]